EKIAATIESHAIGHQVLPTRRRHREGAAGDGQRSRREVPVLPAYAVAGHIASKARAVAHRLNTKYFRTIHQAGGCAVGASAGDLSYPAQTGCARARPAMF